LTGELMKARDWFSLTPCWHNCARLLVYSCIPET